MLISDFWTPELLVFLAAATFPLSVYLAARRSGKASDGFWAIISGTSVVALGFLFEYASGFEAAQALYPIFATARFDWIVAGLFVAPGALLTVWGVLQWLPKVSRLMTEIRRRAHIEQELRDSEERFRIMVQDAPEAITLVDAETGLYVACNPAAETLHGYSEDELRHEVHPWDLSPEFQPDGTPSAERAAAKLREAWNGGRPVFEWLYENTEGRQRLCEVSLIGLPGRNRNLIRASIQDITRRKQTEEVLRRMQKMEALSVLSSGAAHDFNNLLAVIDGSARLIEGKSQEDRDLLANITAAVERGSKLTRSLLTFAKEQPISPEHVTLSDVVRPFVQVLQRTLGSGISVEEDLAADLWPCLVDTGQLEDAILNLAINARDAMQGQGRLVITCANTTVSAERARRCPAAEPGDYVELSVTDTGEGIAPDHIARVFEPFYSTKGPQAGSGLGLAMVLGFASQSGGFVDIDSTPGQGTTVSVFLPRRRAGAEAAA